MKGAVTQPHPARMGDPAERAAPKDDTSMSEAHAAAAQLLVSAQPPQSACAESSKPPFCFQTFSESLQLTRFAEALSRADLTSNYINTCDTPLTIFAPTDDAFLRLGEQLPTDLETLRELMCVHMTLGMLWCDAKSCSHLRRAYARACRLPPPRAAHALLLCCAASRIC